jgi:hypothetical protein
MLKVITRPKILNLQKTASTSEEATDVFTFAAAESDATNDIVLVTPEPENNAHKNTNERALENSCTVLKEIDDILKQNHLFCSEEHHQEWTKDIADCLAQ